MREILKSKKFLIPSLAIAVVYVLLIIYLMNYRLTKDTLLGDYSFGYKWNIMVSLIEGMGTSMTRFAASVLLLTGILTGVNLTLVALRIAALRTSGKLHVMVGGSSLLAIVGSGCAACGLPVIGLLGLSGSVAYLPFRGTELSIIAVLLLLMTLYFMVITYPTEQVCKIISNSYEKR